METLIVAGDGRSLAHRHRVLILLVVVYAINIMDRQVLALLLDDIKREFALSDSQLGLLGGLAFAFFYAFLGIPLARWADRGNPGRVLAICALVWSVATMCCGLAVGFLSLLLARMLTAAGEAGGSPASHSLISRHFPPHSRATALSLYALGVPLGAVVGNLASGWLNEVLPWRAVFVVVGLPGLVMALLVSMAVGGPRHGVAPHAAAVPSVRDAFSGLVRHRSYVHMCLAASLHSVAWYAGSTWNAAFLMRSHGLGPGQAGTVIASFSLVGLLGTFAGGWLADGLARRYGDVRWYMWVPALAILGMVPLQFGAYLGDDLQVAVGMFWLMMILASTFFGPSYAVSQALAGDRSRALASSLLLFAQTLIGLGLGPWLAGVISDALAPSLGTDSLRVALAGVGLVNLWCVLHYWLASRGYREDLRTAHAGTSTTQPGGVAA